MRKRKRLILHIIPPSLPSTTAFHPSRSIRSSSIKGQSSEWSLVHFWRNSPRCGCLWCWQMQVHCSVAYSSK